MQFAIEATGGEYALTPNVVGIGEPFNQMVANANLNKVSIMAVLKNSDWQGKLDTNNVQAQGIQPLSDSQVPSERGSKASIQIKTSQVGSQKHDELSYYYHSSNNSFCDTFFGYNLSNDMLSDHYGQKEELTRTLMEACVVNLLHYEQN